MLTVKQTGFQRSSAFPASLTCIGYYVVHHRYLWTEKVGDRVSIILHSSQLSVGSYFTLTEGWLLLSACERWLLNPEGISCQLRAVWSCGQANSVTVWRLGHGLPGWPQEGLRQKTRAADQRWSGLHSLPDAGMRWAAHTCDTGTPPQQEDCWAAQGLWLF